MKAQLLAQLESINADLARLMKELAMYQEKCAVIKAKIEQAKVDIKKYEATL